MGKSSEPTYGVEVIARLFNLTPRRIQQLAKDGVIPKGGRGEYALAPAVRGYVTYLQKQLDRPGGEATLNLNAERARKTKAEADLAEMEAAKRRGDLIEAVEITEGWQAIAAEVRANLLNQVPVRIAALAKGEKNETKLKAMVKTEISQALNALAHTDVDKMLGGE